MVGEPAAAVRNQYCRSEAGSISVYYPAALAAKAGFSQVRVKLKKLLFVKWLELEGAKAIAIYN
ncbi:MAG TPA: hypothetical protein VN379_07065 [Sporomusa sp.]|nr:hypothetical protein [Sporomusa sp.]